MFESKEKKPESPAQSVQTGGAIASKPAGMSLLDIAAAQKHSGRGRLPLVLSIMIAVIAVGASVSAFMMWSAKNGLAMKVSTLTTQVSTFQGQAASLQKANDGFAAQIATLGDANKDLDEQLALFLSSGSSFLATSTTIMGTLAGSDKVPYSLVTSRGIVLAVKNYKDAEVLKVLTPLTGKVIEVVGMHVPGAKDITVNAVNKIPIAQASSSPQ